MKKMVLRALGVLAIGGGCLIPWGDAAAGYVFTVDSSLDGPDINPGDGVCDDGTGACTLRAAIHEANALGGSSTIDVPGGSFGVEFGIGGGEDAAAEGDLDINAAIAINGAGSDGSGPSSFIYGSAGHRVFDVIGGSVTISGVIIYSGGADVGSGCECGGGVYVRPGASLTLSDTIMTQNTSPMHGAAIYNAGTLLLDKTTVALNNSLNGDGGGVYNTGTLTLVDSEITGNIVENTGLGGGLYNVGNLTLTNSTVSGNSASDGGGISTHSPGTAAVSSSTIYGNFGGGMLGDGSAALRNTIIAGHSGLNCTYGAVTSLGHNLEDSDSCGLIGAGDKPNTDPKVRPLSPNGGVTWTHALLAGSPAIDSGDPGAPGSGGTSCPATDQREAARPIEGDGGAPAVCDIGAYEYGDADADGELDSSDADDDNDKVYDAPETNCGSDPLNALVRPERIDGVFVGVSDDGDAAVDEALPPGAGAYDCDGDGYIGSSEVHVTTSDQDACGAGWPSDFVPGGLQPNKLTVQDIGTFVAPVRHFGTSVGNPAFHVRWDLVPGSAIGPTINVADLGAMIAGPTGYPPMFGGQRAFGQTCPWAP